jgi:hypothetical protein
MKIEDWTPEHGTDAAAIADAMRADRDARRRPAEPSTYVESVNIARTMAVYENEGHEIARRDQPCTAERFATGHRYEFNQGADDTANTVGDYELCGRPADDPIHVGDEWTHPIWLDEPKSTVGLDPEMVSQQAAAYADSAEFGPADAHPAFTADEIAALRDDVARDGQPFIQRLGRGGYDRLVAKLDAMLDARLDAAFGPDDMCGCHTPARPMSAHALPEAGA